MSVRYEGGRNIAMKVPPHQYEATVAFYRDTLGLEQLCGHEPAVGFVFGSNQLWIDKAPAASQAEIWLEVVTRDKDAAAAHLEGAGVVRCDEIEPLGPSFRGFWISSPSSIIHLVDEKQTAW
ncbi:glyoxalase/bleomycin resistance/dioxygenase family protein [Aquamicrobium sp. LC103]|uniref:VOC family protein n=1 Tax=Aquamicrobium sp. LC103 TaxID=1120658 RepID=UPI00063E9F0E|nr:glyoxalase/bleomycin resistance/dioxygenase family protein [Aquamicrobium sp. LC103]TKT82574.1 glyoxalase/bleomycin resistance/dioxygenase family protein [Aquamicrobium sp. LC103]